MDMPVNEESILQVGKLEVARRQLETSIRLHSSDGDPVSTHTLAAASCQVLDDLVQTRGMQTLWDEGRNYIVAGREIEFLRNVREAQNFFKHAGRDSDKILEFRPQQTWFMIFSAVTSHAMLTSEARPVIQTFLSWMILCFPDMFRLPQDAANQIEDLHYGTLISDGKAAFFRDVLPLLEARALGQAPRGPN